MKNPLALVLAIATGIARDQTTRRKAMLALTLAALAMLFAGSIPLWNFFVAHPLVFAFYWLACAWVTVCVILLAAYDLLAVFEKSRRERRAAKKHILDHTD